MTETESDLDIQKLPQGVLKIILNRPDVHNALNESLILGLTEAFQTHGQDPDVRVILLDAVGKSFCAGADLTWMQRTAAYSPADNRADARTLAMMMTVIDLCPKPTMALVKGAVYGGGIGLVCACDIAIAEKDAVFCLSEVRLGLTPAIISPYVIRAIGQRQARRYMMTAERIDAESALDLGLVHVLVREGELDSIAIVMVQSLLKGSPDALKDTKDLIRYVGAHDLDEALQEETAHRIAMARASPEGREGVEAYLAKRMPNWAGEH